MKTQRITLVLGIAIFALGAGARADTRIEKNLKLEPGGRFELESSGGDVEITGTSQSGAHIVVTSNRDDLQDLYDLNFAEESGGARVEAHRRGGWSSLHNFKLKFRVEVPTRTGLEINTGGGDVQASNLEGAFNLRTSGGDLILSELKGNLEAHTSGGDVKVRGVTGDARLGTSGGDIRVEGVTGRLEAKTSGGDVEVTLARGNARGGEVETSGGTINVSLDPSVNLNLDASSSGGDLKSDLPMKISGTVSESRLHATLGSGGETLRLHTSGGDIRIRGL